jgi:uncharacterized coiled-coil protein SlyX
MSNATTDHLKALLKDDGHQFAMVRKADLAALLQVADADPHQGRYLNPLGEVNRTMAEQSQVIDEAFKTLRKNALIARKHGDERRRYMGNNRALLAHTEQLEATVAEMGGVIDSQSAEVAELRYQVETFAAELRKQMGATLYAESQLAIVRRALA